MTALGNPEVDNIAGTARVLFGHVFPIPIGNRARAGARLVVEFDKDELIEGHARPAGARPILPLAFGMSAHPHPPTTSPPASATGAGL